jgi:hypothetical protein
MPLRTLRVFSLCSLRLYFAVKNAKYLRKECKDSIAQNALRRSSTADQPQQS